MGYQRSEVRAIASARGEGIGGAYAKVVLASDGSRDQPFLAP